MAGRTTKRSTTVGLPPGSLVHIGEKKAEAVTITLVAYNEFEYDQHEVTAFEQCLPVRDAPFVTWININGIHSVQAMARLGSCFKIHPLILEDILSTDQRPKLEDMEDYLYVALTNLTLDEEDGRVVKDQVSIVLGPNYVISFQEGDTNFFAPIMERLGNGKARMRRMGADYLAYALLDLVVDHYFLVLEKFGERIESLEEALVNPTPRTLRRLHDLRHDTIFARKSIWPLREVINALLRRDSPLVRDTTIIYLRDVYDHIIQEIDTVETFRDMLAGMMDIYLSSVSNRLNTVMKVLTGIATIFMPLTFLAGVYGMNFKYMPELEWEWGYPAILLIMGAIALSMFVHFRRKQWL